MKIGLSLSRCVLDIYENRINSHDVLVIIARTDINPHNDEQWRDIWIGYHVNNPEWIHLGDTDEEPLRHLLTELYDSGLIHQPRQFGVRPRRLNYHWLETILFNDDLDRNPSAKKAWEQFQIISGLSSSVDRFNDNF